MEIDLFSMGYGNTQHNARYPFLRELPNTEEILTFPKADLSWQKPFFVVSSTAGIPINHSTLIRRLPVGL